MKKEKRREESKGEEGIREGKGKGRGEGGEGRGGGDEEGRRNEVPFKRLVQLK